MNLTDYYEKGRYTKDEIKGIQDFAKKRIKYLEGFISETNPQKILELGCGDGALSAEIKEIVPDSTIFGIDISQSAVNLAKKKGIRAKKADLNKKLPFNSSSFDLIISDQLIEHIYDTDLLMSESYRILKKGGYLITITPNLSFWLNRFIFPFGIYPIFSEVSSTKKNLGLGIIKDFIHEDQAMGHIRVFNGQALKDMMNLSGFKIIKAKGIPFPFALPNLPRLIYQSIDWIFSKRYTLARDLMIIAQK